MIILDIVIYMFHLNTKILYNVLTNYDINVNNYWLWLYVYDDDDENDEKRAYNHDDVVI